MPTLRQLRCSIELPGSNLSLREYGTTYSDGFVETFIVIPSQPTGFCIHLTSDGYIAPGLSMFVYTDGVYQCNRNRSGLVIPDENTPTSQAVIDFRVRQKEEMRDDGGFIGREWRFEKLNVVSADAAPSIDPDVSGNIGTIEVVVLRCQEPRREISPTRVHRSSARARRVLHKRSRPASVKAVSATASVNNDDDDTGGMSDLFDGPSDEPPYFYRPESRRDPRRGLWHEPYEYVEYRSPLPHWRRYPPYERPDLYPMYRDDNRDEWWRENHPEKSRYTEPVTPARSHAIEERGYYQVPKQHYGYYHPNSYYAPPRGYRLVEPLREPGPVYYAYEPRTSAPHVRWRGDRGPPPHARPTATLQDPRNEYLQEQQRRDDRYRHKREQSGSSTGDADDFSQNHNKGNQARGNNRRNASGSRNVSGSSGNNRTPGVWDNRSGNTGWNTNNSQSNWQNDNTDQKSREQNEAAESNGWDSNDQNKNEQGNDWINNNDATGSGGTSWENNNILNKGRSGKQGLDEQNWNNLANQGDNAGNWDNNDAQNKDFNDHGGWENANDQNGNNDWSADDQANDRDSRGTWNTPAQVQQSTDSDNHKPKTGSTKTSVRGNASSCEEPHIKPYWSKWSAKSAAKKELADSNIGKRRSELVYIAPEEPLYTVSENTREDKKVEHQVRAGKGAHYQHPTRKPIYMDTMEKPYAIFRFKYRSKEMLEQMLDITLEEDAADLKKRLQSMSKDELIAELLKTKAVSSDDALADYNGAGNACTSKDKTAEENNDKGVRAENKSPINPFHEDPKRSEYRKSDKVKAIDSSQSASKMTRKNDAKSKTRSSNSARTGWNNVAGPDTNDRDTRNTSWVTPGDTDQNDPGGGWDNGNGAGGNNSGGGLEQVGFW